MGKSRIGFAAVLTCSCATAAWGQQAPTLPGVITAVTFDGPTYHDVGTGTYSTTYDNAFGGPPTSGTMTATVDVERPSISLDMTGCCSDYSPGEATVFLEYFAELTGPSSNNVPMELFENLTSSSTGPDISGNAEIDVYGATSAQEILSSSGGTASDYVSTGSSPGILRFNATPGLGISIVLTVRGGAANGETFSSADPYLAIDPSFAATDPNYATNYSLSFSPGVVNTLASTVSGVPEPSTWALMLLGFGVIGAARRRHKIEPNIRLGHRGVSHA